MARPAPAVPETDADRAAWRVDVVADSDSRWKWGATVTDRLLGGRPAEVHGTLVLGRSVPTEQQLADVGARTDSLRRASIAEIVARLADTDADVVVLACIGGGVQSLLQALARVWAGRTRRPVVVTGYVGLVYEKIVDGLVNRAGADLVLANCEADAENFARVFADLGADPESVVATALPFLGGAPYDPDAAGRDRRWTLTVATQPGVPETKAERTDLLRRAAQFATAHPDRDVVMKLRARPGERTTHVEPHHYTTLVPAAELPPNLTFVYGAMEPVLDRTDLLVTVSSTAAVEAMHRGIPTAVLTDYGVREVIGNGLFLGSGAMTSWPELIQGHVPVTRPEWARRHGVVVAADAYDAAAARLAGLVAARDALPPLTPWLSRERAGAYLPSLLARYGLDAEGRPTAPADPVQVPPLRRFARRVARRAYRYGVTTLEPRVKRLAQM